MLVDVFIIIIIVIEETQGIKISSIPVDMNNRNSINLILKLPKQHYCTNKLVITILSKIMPFM